MTTLTRAAKTDAAYEALLERRLVHVLSVTVIDAILDAPTVHKLFTCPTGKQAVITAVIFHSNTATLAGMIDVNLGGGVAAITPVWLDNQSLAGLTVANSFLEVVPAADVIIIDGDDSTPANRTLNAQVVTGSTGAADVTVDVLGYLIDS